MTQIIVWIVNDFRMYTVKVKLRHAPQIYKIIRNFDHQTVERVDIIFVLNLFNWNVQWPNKNKITIELL